MNTELRAVKMVFFVDLLVLNVNCVGSRQAVVLSVLEIHFIKALHLKGDCDRTGRFLGTDTMVAIWKQAGTLF